MVETKMKGSDQEQNSQALLDSQARLMGIIASAMDAIITIDENRGIVLFNAAAETMFGYSSREVLGKQIDIFIPERFRSIHREHIRKFGETGVTNRTMGRLGRLFGRRKNGQEFPIETSISQVDLAEGKLFTVILRDVSERANFEEKLIENEQSLRATFDQAAVGIAHIALDGQFLRVNQKLIEITGYNQEELIHRKFQEITHPDDLQADLDHISQVISGKIQTYSLEKRYIRKNGEPIWVNLAVSLVRDATGEPKYLLKVIEEITERKNVEAALLARNDEINNMTRQLWQTAKLATMGELAASVAHELNNPLAILSLRIESLLSNLSESSPEHSELTIMEQEIDRMAALVGNLLQFSRSGQRQISSLDLREEIERTLDLIRSYMAHRHVTVHEDFPANLPLIHADRQQLRQLFLNLFTNASDAMAEGGTLLIRISSREEDPMMKIDIQDSGVGIRPEDMRRILEPFYTTKKEGKGTGLGLPICKRIVEEHGGSFRISSPGYGKGTIVEIMLPAVKDSKPSFLDD